MAFDVTKESRVDMNIHCGCGFKPQAGADADKALDAALTHAIKTGHKMDFHGAIYVTEKKG